MPGLLFALPPSARKLCVQGCDRITFCSSEDECRGRKKEHLSRPVLPKQGIQLKETWVYFGNWCFPKMKLSGRVKLNNASGLPVP